MMSQEKTSLRFVSWNTRGIKNPPQKFSDVLNILRILRADIGFIQETQVGPNCFFKNIEEDKTGIKWKVYFTVHSPQSKGVAILIKDNIQFEYICHDEDCSGGYIVLFCHLYGELYTLVNVYNHKSDRIVLGRLKDYIKETAEGVLVVGGDFNVVLNPSTDCISSAVNKQQSQLRDILEGFTAFLNLENVRPTNEQFTRRQNESYPRIDMFFLSKDRMGRVRNIKIENEIPEVQRISDHYPLLLKFTVKMQTERQNPRVATWLKELKYTPDIRPGKISGAEILSAIKSLPDTDPVRDYKTNCCPLTETLKITYNKMLTNQPRPGNFRRSEDRLNKVENLIFSEILAKRLTAFISLETNCDIGVIVTFERSQLEIKWSFLETLFEKLHIEYADGKLKQIHSAPPPEFSILDHLLPQVQNSSWNLRSLQPGCPLTNAILNLTLHQLENLCTTKCYRSTACYLSQTLHIDAQQDSREEVIKLVEKFQDDSGIRLSFT